MTKGDFPALRMTIDGGRLIPAGQFDAERLHSYRRGTVVLCRFTEEKDRVLVRKWWAILSLVVKQCETPWKTKEEASEAIKLALGIVNLSKTVSGQFMQYPKSLTELDDPEMTEALEQMTALLSRMTGVDVETLKKETAHVGAESENDNQVSDEPSPSSEPAGDTASAPAAAGEDSDPPPPGSSPAASLTEAEWLKTAARMLWSATNVGGDTDANLAILNNQRLAVGDLCPPETANAIKEKAGSIYRVCKQAVLSEAPPHRAVPVIAAYAGMDEKELQA